MSVSLRRGLDERLGFTLTMTVYITIDRNSSANAGQRRKSGVLLLTKIDDIDLDLRALWNKHLPLLFLVHLLCAPCFSLRVSIEPALGVVHQRRVFCSVLGDDVDRRVKSKCLVQHGQRARQTSKVLVGLRSGEPASARFK